MLNIFNYCVTFLELFILQNWNYTIEQLLIQYLDFALQAIICLKVFEKDYCALGNNAVNNAKPAEENQWVKWRDNW